MNITINPIWGVGISIAGFLLTFLGATSTQFPSYVPAFVADDIRSTALFLGPVFSGITAILFGFSSNKLGPFVSSQVTPPSAPIVPPKLSLILIAGFIALVILLEGSGRAQAKALTLPQIPNLLQPAKPAAIATDINSVLTKLNAITDEDLANAIAIATKGKATTLATCLMAMQTLKGSMSAADAATTQPVHVISDFAKLYLLRAAFRTDSDFSNACAPVAEAIKMDVVSLIAGVAAGSITLSTFGL